MGQKVNPAKTENGLSNFRLAVVLLNHLSNDLPRFPLERKLTDSFLLRYIPVVYGHLVLGIRNWIKDLSRTGPSEFLKSGEEIQTHAEVYAARIITYLRLRGNSEAYEVVRSMTQGHSLTKTKMYEGLKPYVELEDQPHLKLLLDM